MTKKPTKFKSQLTGQIAKLTERERECLLWSALGKRTKQIAAILNISQATTNEYIHSAMRKLDASTRTQAVAKLLQRRTSKPQHIDPRYLTDWTSLKSC